MPRTTQSQPAGHGVRVDKPLTPAQKAAQTRARNQQAQEAADRKVANEMREPRSSKVKGRAKVNEWIQAGNNRVRKTPATQKKRVHSDSEEEDIEAPLAKKFHQYNSQPPLGTSMARSAPPSRNAHTSEDEPAEKPKRSSRGSERNYDPAVHDNIVEPQDDEEEDAASIAEEEEERRDMSDVDRDSDGEGDEAGDEDLEALATRPEALKAALRQEMPHAIEANESLEDECPMPHRKRKTLPRRFLDDDFNEDVSEHNMQEDGLEVPMEEDTDADNSDKGGAADEEDEPAPSNPEAVGSVPQPHQRSSAIAGQGRQQGRRAQARIAERANPSDNALELHPHPRTQRPSVTPASQPQQNPETQQGSKWPPETDLVRSKRDAVPLTKQNAHISALGHAAIDAFYADLMFRAVVPPVTQKLLYYQAILEECTRQLQADTGDRVFKTIRHRIRQDAQYVKYLITLADDRLHHKRCTAKKVVLPHLEGEYRLVSGGHQRFGELSNEFAYLFPVDGQGNILWLRPFMRTIFATVTFMLFFAGPNSFAARYASRFPKVNGQPAIPQGMVCYVAVVIYMAMYDVAYKGTHFSVQTKAANWDAEYKAIWDFVEGFKTRSPRLFSDLMVELYRSASRGQELQPRVKAVHEVLAKINFNENQ
ncbi:hypothetical protein K474DRAFT_1680269 [Panus rudis PR-1116 ss-1]|nr:hypothetical protein K474DRAFT_1680269 [Panus rudis PR-1116 ss-1]